MCILADERAKNWRARPHCLAKAKTPRDRSHKKRHPVGAFFAGSKLLGTNHVETLVEAVNAAAGSDITLLTGVERVALVTHVQVQIVTNGRVGLDHVAARAGCSDSNVVRVDTFFHGKTSVKAASLSGPLPPDTTRG